MKIVRHLAMALAFLALAACGETTGDRGLSGAGIGAAAGAVGGALVGAPLAGAAIGGAAGAATGALTSPNQIDLGRPAWEH
jgi:osmotically inducible lipoprotein OsmB